MEMHMSADRRELSLAQVIRGQSFDKLARTRTPFAVAFRTRLDIRYWDGYCRLGQSAAMLCPFKLWQFELDVAFDMHRKQLGTVTKVRWLWLVGLRCQIL